MRTPIKSLPQDIDHWVGRARWFRSLDALAAWLTLWAGMSFVLPEFSRSGQATVAAVVVAIGIAIAPVRVLWRPVTGKKGRPKPPLNAFGIVGEEVNAQEGRGRG